MIAAFSMAFLAYASPLASAKDYIWTTPNMPSNISGVVAGPFARTEDIAYIHEAIAERRVLGGLSSGSSIIVPTTVVRAPNLPLTPAQAQANGWQVVSTGIVDGVVNVLAYRETVTNWPTAGGVDTWRMQPVTFSLPGGNWLDPSNDVTSLTSAIGDSFTNCFNPWRGYMQQVNMTLSGLAWRPGVTNVLSRLEDYDLDVVGGYSTNNSSIYKITSTYYDVTRSEDGKSISLVPSPRNGIRTVTNGVDMGFSANRTAYKVTAAYTDDDGNLQPCGGSPISYTDTYVVSTVGSMANGQNVRAFAPIAFCFSTGGVWRVKSAKAIAAVSFDYSHTRFVTGTGYETVSSTNGYVCVPVSVVSTTEDDAGNIIAVITTPLHTIAESAAQFAGVPTSDSGFIPSAPQGEIGVEDSIYNYENEELVTIVQSFAIILTVEPLTTIQELQ